MKNFNKFITEAKIAKNELERAATIFKKQFEKRMSTKLYRFGGPEGYTEVANGLGILYFYNKYKAFRFNYINGEIKSVTVWKKYHLGEHGDFTVDLGGLSIVQVGKHLMDILANPKVGSMEIYPEVYEDLESDGGNFLAEAKRVGPEVFVGIVREFLAHHGGNVSLTSVPWEIITAAAEASGVSIPYTVKEVKVAGTKGANARFNIAALVGGQSPMSRSDDNEGEESSDTSGKVVPTYYVKITAQDPNTKKFLSVKQDSRAEGMLKQMTSALNNPNVEKEMKDPETLFGIMRNLTQLVCRGSRNSLVIYGGPGIGKSYVVEKTVKEEGLQKNKDFFVIKGRITTSSLYQTLFMHRKGSLLMFDDADSVWGDQDSANLLKAALDSYDVRTISWISNRTVNVSKMTDEAKEEFNQRLDDKLLVDPDDRSIKFPSSFDFEGRIIFISNLTKDKFDEAILNRSAKIDMTLTKEQVFMRMEGIIDQLGSKDVPKDVKLEILDFLKQQTFAGIMTNVSMRTFVAAEDLYRSGLPNWRELLDYV